MTKKKTPAKGKNVRRRPAPLVCADQGNGPCSRELPDVPGLLTGSDGKVRCLRHHDAEVKRRQDAGEFGPKPAPRPNPVDN